MWTRKALMWKSSLTASAKKGKRKLPAWTRDILFEILLVFLVVLPIFAGIASMGGSYETYSLPLLALRLAAPFCIVIASGMIVSEHTPA
jgi:hypothetical protein